MGRRFFCALCGGLCVCAVLLGGGRYPVLPFDPISLVLAQRNGVEPPKKSAFLPRWLHHSRERFCLSCRYSSSPDLGRGRVLVGGFLRVRRYAGRWSLACPAIRPHFFGACPKKRCRAAKEKRFDASTSPWWARPPLPFGSKPQRDKLVRQVDLYSVGRPGTQVSLTQSAVMLGIRVRGRGGWDRTAAVAAHKSAGGGLRGNPRRGFPLFFTFLRVRRFLG